MTAPRSQSAPYRALVSAILGLVGMLAVSCGTERATEVPGGRSIILITIDTLRSDRLPAYGHDRIETPAIDTLRTDGILYERAYSPIPLTFPAHASLFTGLLPPETGVRDNAGYRLDASTGLTLAEKLGAAGYATGGVVSAWVLRRETGIARGFDLWDDSIEQSGSQLMGDLQRSGFQSLERVLPWLDSVDDQPFFLFFHIYEPHAPRTPPEPFASRYADPYDGEVATADAVMGELFDALKTRGLYDGSTIILLSDHGEGLGDHGEDDHGILIYRESIQVPLIVKLPEHRFAGSAVAAPVHLADVAPTVLSLAGIVPPEDLVGVSLLSFLDGREAGAPTEERALYSETFHPQLSYGWSGLTSVVRGRYHYIQGVDRELYDLLEDPAERHNLVREDRRTYSTLRDALARFDSELDQPFEESSETRRNLAALGYLGSGPAATDGPLIDPKTRIADVTLIQQGISQVMEERTEEAVETLKRATERLPGSIDAWQFLGLALQKENRPDEALEAYRRAFELSNGAPYLAKPMSYLAFRLQRWDDATAYSSLVLESEPDNVDLRLLQARALLFTGRADDALATVDRALETAPERAEAHYLRGAVQMGRKELADAEAELGRALELDPDNRAALSDLAVLLMSQGRRPEARPLLERLAELRPDAPPAAPPSPELHSKRP